MDKDCFGEYNRNDCYRCDVAVECYEERNNQLMYSLASGNSVNLMR